MEDFIRDPVDHLRELECRRSLSFSLLPTARRLLASDLSKSRRSESFIRIRYYSYLPARQRVRWLAPFGGRWGKLRQRQTSVLLARLCKPFAIPHTVKGLLMPRVSLFCMVMALLITGLGLATCHSFPVSPAFAMAE